MPKVYKVWIDIEEYDTDTEDGQPCDAPGGSLAEFATYEEAREFAWRITGPHTADAFDVQVTIDPSEYDVVPVVFIDTPNLDEDAAGPRCRIYLNDACLHENPPFTGKTKEYSP